MDRVRELGSVSLGEWGAVAGIVAAIAAVVGLILAIIWRRQRREKVKLPPPAQETAPAGSGLETSPDEIDAFFVPFNRNTLLEHEDPWITKIKDKLAEGGGAVVGQAAVHGGGGIGKTAMALEYAYRFSGDYPGGAFWLMADQGLGQAIWELAGRMAVQGKDLGLKPGQNDEDYVRAMTSFLSRREKSLVILDNVEDPKLPAKLILQKSDV